MSYSLTTHKREIIIKITMECDNETKLEHHKRRLINKINNSVGKTYKESDNGWGSYKCSLKMNTDINTN